MSMDATTELDGVTITRPARHGLVMDWVEADGTRVQVRLWTFAPGEVVGVVTELPATLPESRMLPLLREAERRLAPVLLGKGVAA